MRVHSAANSLSMCSKRILTPLLSWCSEGRGGGGEEARDLYFLLKEQVRSVRGGVGGVFLEWCMLGCTDEYRETEGIAPWLGSKGELLCFMRLARVWNS